MATRAKRVKDAKEPKFSSRKHNRCRNCGRPRGYIRKFAVRSFARTMSTDLKGRQIRVNAISPGSTDTPGFSELVGSSEVGQERIKALSTAIPLGRLGRPEEIAKAVTFLASEESSYITGIELFVDGGMAQV